MAYMNRLKQMYESATGKEDVNTDPFALQQVYTKVTQSLDSSARAEMKRLTDFSVGSLSYALLIKNVTKAISLADRGPGTTLMAATTPTWDDAQIEAITRQWKQEGSGNQRSDGFRNNQYGRKTGSGFKSQRGKQSRDKGGQKQPQQERIEGNCFHCGIYGHKIADCRKRKNGEPKTAQAREPKGGEKKGGRRS